MLSMELVATAAVRKSVHFTRIQAIIRASLWVSMGGTAHLPCMNDDRPRFWTPSELSEYTGIPIRLC